MARPAVCALGRWLGGLAALAALCAVAVPAAAQRSRQHQQQHQYQYPATQYPVYTPPPPAALPLQVQTYAAAPDHRGGPQTPSPQQPGGAGPPQAVAPQQAPLAPLSYDEWTRAVDAIISRGVLQLSLSLAEAVEHDGDVTGQVSNVVFSPVNVAAALALVLAGSNGTTFQEIAGVLGIAAGVNLLENRELVHKEFGRFLGQLESRAAVVPGAGNASGGNQVVFANGLFVQQEYRIQPHFAEVAGAYRSQVIPVEFLREPGRAKDRINSWFSEHTMGRIRSVLSEAPPTDTKLMIASALFFNGEWETPFPVEATMTRPFYGASSNGSREAAAVRMMTNNMELPFAADRALGCRLLELPYRGRDVSMFLVLPDAQGLAALRDLERRLTAEVLDRLIDSRKDAPVIYSVPRMKLERSISLRTALETLGVHSLFDENLADLTHLSDSVVERGPTPPPPAAGPPAQARPPPPAAKPLGAGAPATASPAGADRVSEARPRPTRRPAGENAIGPDAHFYFSSRISSLLYADNNTVQVEPVVPLGDRWSAPPPPPQPQPSARLYADDVLHKVEVEVTETGTVASAATAITISRDGSNHVMRLNRPFLFFIRHNPTKLVLFYGSVVRPMPEWIVPGVDVTQLPPARPVPGLAPGLAPGRVPPPQGRQPAGKQRPHAAAPASTPRTSANG